SELVFQTTSLDRTIIEALIDAATVHGSGSIAVEDPVTGSLSYRRLLAGAAVLGRKLMPLAAVGEAVGVMLPNANGAAVTIFALMSAGRIPALINFSAGAADVRPACKAPNDPHIIPSPSLLANAPLPP